MTSTSLPRVTFAATPLAGSGSFEELAAAFEENTQATTEALGRANDTIDDLRRQLDERDRRVIPGVGRRQGPMRIVDGRPVALSQMATDEDRAGRLDRDRGVMLAFMRTGDHRALTAVADSEFAAPLQVSSEVDGGYLVPEEVAREIMTFLRNGSAMRRISRLATSRAAEFKIPVNKGGLSAGWVTEHDDRPETDAPKWGMLSVPTNEVYAQPAVTQQLLDDSAFDVLNVLQEDVRITFNEKENAAFITGDGVSKPLGFLSVPLVAESDDVRAWGKIEFVSLQLDTETGKPTSCDQLIDLVYTLKAGYRANATWLMNSKTAGIISKIKDADGNYVWRQSVERSQPSTLLGYPVEIDENMPDVANGTFPIAFGDFNRGYLIVDRIDMRVLRDPYTRKGYVLFYCTKRVGGSPYDTNAIKVLKALPAA
ncbi:phage major capsid protein [Hansschlegelia zhihuaiae]|nr:phage major capsid protein [Hansschlegelia zhihuaiae]